MRRLLGLVHRLGGAVGPEPKGHQGAGLRVLRDAQWCVLQRTHVGNDGQVLGIKTKAVKGMSVWRQVVEEMLITLTGGLVEARATGCVLLNESFQSFHTSPCDVFHRISFILVKVILNMRCAWVNQNKNALAGNRTRISCLEGMNANHYTTNACRQSVSNLNI